MPDLTCAICPTHDVAEASWIVNDTQDWKKLAAEGPSGMARHDLLDFLRLNGQHEDGIRNLMPR